MVPILTPEPPYIIFHEDLLSLTDTLQLGHELLLCILIDFILTVSGNVNINDISVKLCNNLFGSLFPTVLSNKTSNFLVPIYGKLFPYSSDSIIYCPFPYKALLTVPTNLPPLLFCPVVSSAITMDGGYSTNLLSGGCKDKTLKLNFLLIVVNSKSVFLFVTVTNKSYCVLAISTKLLIKESCTVITPVVRSIVKSS